MEQLLQWIFCHLKSFSWVFLKSINLGWWLNSHLQKYRGVQKSSDRQGSHHNQGCPRRVTTGPGNKAPAAIGVGERFSVISDIYTCMCAFGHASSPSLLVGVWSLMFAGCQIQQFLMVAGSLKIKNKNTKLIIIIKKKTNSVDFDPHFKDIWRGCLC